MKLILILDCSECDWSFSHCYRDGNRCLTRYGGARDWFHARQKCHEMSGTLAVDLYGRFTNTLTMMLNDINSKKKNTYNEL